MSKANDNELVTRGILRFELEVFRKGVRTEIQTELQKFETRILEEQDRKLGIMFERTQDLILQLGETMEMRFERLERMMDVAKEWLSNHEDRITVLEANPR